MSSAIAAKKRAEGEECMRAAEKAKKTSPMKLKFSPDWESAYSEYEKAITCFKVAKDMQRAIDACIMASEAHTHLDHRMYMSAKHLETAAFIAKNDLKRPDEAARLYVEAATFHQMDGEHGNAAEDLSKAGRSVEESEPERGAKLMTQACASVAEIEEEGKLAMGVDVYKQAVAYLLRVKQFSEAAELLKKQAVVHTRLQQPHGVARCELSITVVLLAADNFDGAEERHYAALERGDGYAGSDEVGVGSRLLAAFTSQSDEEVAAAVKEHTLTHLENQVARAAKTLTLQSAGVPMHKIDRGGAASGGGAGAGGSGASSGGGGALPLAGTGDFGEVAPEDEVDDDDLT